MSLLFDLGARIRTRDGEDAGTLERVVFDPQANAAREFVVDTGGLLGRQVLVPQAELESASRDGDVLRLRLNKAALDKLPTYVPEHFSVPPTGWSPPVGFGFPDGAYLWPTAVVHPDGDREQVSLPRGAAVLDGVGEHVGVVDDLRLNPTTGALEAFRLRVGGTLRTLFGGGDVVEVTRSQIDSLDEGLVRLRLTKDELERLAREREEGTGSSSAASTTRERGEPLPEPQDEAAVGTLAGMAAGAAAGGAVGGPVGAVVGGGLGAAAGAHVGQEVGEERDKGDDREVPKRHQRAP